MEVFVDDETKLTLHGLQQYYCKLKDSEKNRKLFDLLDVLEFNQVRFAITWHDESVSWVQYTHEMFTFFFWMWICSPGLALSNWKALSLRPLDQD